MGQMISMFISDEDHKGNDYHLLNAAAPEDYLLQNKVVSLRNTRDNAGYTVCD